MCSTRVESPLISEFRRQPSPQRASRMPKPPACRKLFPVDQGEAERLLKDQMAELKEEQNLQSRKYGFDFDRGEPLPDADNSSGYEWEAVPGASVPEVYRETVGKHKPSRPGSKPTPPSFTSSFHLQSTNNGHSKSALDSSSPNIPSGARHDTEDSSHSCSLVQPEDDLPAKSFIPKDISPPDVSESAGACELLSSDREPLDHVEESITGSSASEPLTNNSRTTETQTKVTDYMRQRKRTGSGSSLNSVSSSGDDGEKHQIPGKRRRRSSSDTPSPATGLS